MDTTLVTVTLLSMGMAAALSVIVWRMLRDERERGEARVLALAQRAAQSPARGQGIRDERTGSRDEGPPARDLILRATPTADVMFAERETSSPWGGRFAVMACLALVLASGILLTLTARGRAGTEERQAPAARAAVAPGDRVATRTATELELRSLRDARDAAALRITGLVQNPRSGATLAGVTVTAYAFDDKGSFLASGRARLDVSTLAPGDESPFVVSVPMTEAVARYRIGFRGEDGHVIAHVDKRPQAPAGEN